MKPFVRLIAFYVVLGVVVYGLARLVPALDGVLRLDLSDASAAQQFQQALSQPSLQEGLPGAGDRPAWLVVLVALVGSLVFAFPVVWAYTITKRDEGYEQPVVQMIIMLPVAVAAVVLVVFNSLPLAFALAGIVAAVRFRTTLKDVNDAVFAFVAIGIGLAAGIQSWLLAGALSFVFSVLALTLWKIDLGRTGRRRRDATLAGALVGDGSAVAAGDPAALAPLGTAERDRLSGYAEQLARHVRADALRGKGAYQFLLLVHTPQPDVARLTLDDALEGAVKRSHLVFTVPGRDGVSVLAYLVRLKQKTEIGPLLDDILELDGVKAVEIAPVRDLR
jgi:hypothetical protein